MAEPLGLDTYVNTVQFEKGMTVYLSGIQRMITGTDTLSSTMSATAGPTSAFSANMQTLATTLDHQTRQLDILDAELLQLLTDQNASTLAIQKQTLAFDMQKAVVAQTGAGLDAYWHELKEAEAATKSAGDATGGATNAFATFLGTLGGNLATKAIQFIVQGIQQAGQALLQLGKDALEAVASQETLGFALESLSARELLASGQATNMADALGQAAPRAEELLGWIEDLAIKSPFTQEDIAQTLRLAQAYGFSSDEAQELTQTLVDFTAGSGQSGDVAQRLALALGQIQAKGKVSADNLRQLTEAGFNSNTVLKDMGFNLDDVSNGLVEADGFVKAVIQTLNRDFGGAAERQTETWTGLISTLGEIKTLALRDLFTDLFTAVQPLVADLSSFLTSDDVREGLRNLGEQIGEAATAATVLANQIDWKQLAADIDLAATVATRLGKGLAEGANNLRNSGAVGAGAFSDQSLQLTLDSLLAVGDATRQLLVYADRVIKFYDALGGANEVLLEQGDTWTLIESNVAFATGAYEYSEQVLQRNEDAARRFQNALAEANKEFLHLPKDAGQPKEIGSGIGHGGLSDRELEERIETLETLNDAFEDHAEKVKSINDDIADAAQDNDDKMKAAQAGLAQDYQKYTQERKELAVELYADLTDLAEDHNDTLAKLTQERNALIVQFDADLLAAKAEGQQKETEMVLAHIATLVDIEKERNTQRAERDAELIALNEESLREQEEQQRKHNETLADLDLDLMRTHEDFDRKREQAIEDLLGTIDELHRTHTEKLKGYDESLAEAAQATADKRRDIEKDLLRDLDDLAERHADRQEKHEEDIAEFKAKLSPIAARMVEEGQEKLSTFLDKADREKLAKIQKQLDEENAEYEEQKAQLEADAQEALDKEQQRLDKKVEQVKAAIDKENEAYEIAADEAQARYDREAENRQIQYDRAVVDLETRLQRENEGFNRQTEDNKRELDKRTKDIEDSYNEAIAKLDARLATENEKHTAQRTKLQEGNKKELEDLQAKHDEALLKVDTRFKTELTKYDEQRAAIIDKNKAEVADLDASYAERVQVVKAKLRDIAVEHATRQLELRAQMDETNRDFEEKLGEMAEAWQEPKDASQKYKEYLEEFQGWLKTTIFPINFQHNLPEFAMPGSPSPLEESLRRTIDLMEDMGRVAPRTFDNLPISSDPVNSPASQSPVASPGNSFTINLPGELIRVDAGQINNLDDARGVAREALRPAEDAIATRLLEAAIVQRASSSTWNPGDRT